MLTLFSSKKIQITVIVVLTALAYSNIFANDFAIDDGDFIYNWPLIRVGEIGEVGGKIGRIFGGESVPEDHAGVYRSVKAIFMMLWLNVFGVRAFWFHLFSISVHLVNTILVYLITLLLIRSYSYKSRILMNEKLILTNKRMVSLLPFVVGLLFGLHPIHSEAVTFVLASFDTLGITFYLASFWLYAKGSRSSIRKTRNYIWRVVSVILAVLGYFTYELAVTLPAVIVLYEFCLWQTQISTDIKSRLARIKLILVRSWPYWLSLVWYVWVRFFALHLAGRGEYLGGSFYKTALVMSCAFAKYIELLIWPANLSIDQAILPGIFSVVYKDFVNAKTLAELSLFSPAVFLSLLILLVLALVMVWCWYRHSVISFGIGWFLVTLLPVAFVFPQSSVMAERYVYLASFGFILVLSYLTCELYANVKRINANVRMLKVILICVAVIMVLGYGVRTYVRNMDWRDTQTVWEKLTQQSPDNPVANYTLAKIYAERGANELAIVYFEKALATHPKIAEVNFRLGRIYYDRGDMDLAEKYFLAAGDGANPKYFFQARRELAKIEYLRSPSFAKAMEGKQSDKWVKYTLEKRVTFEYPQLWLVTKFEHGVTLDDLNVPFYVEVIFDKMLAGESFQTYLARQPDHFGKLVGEGQARVPNVTVAYVKVWKEDEVDRLEFFLNKDDAVVKILVYPANSPKMAEFDKVLASITIK